MGTKQYFYHLFHRFLSHFINWQKICINSFFHTFTRFSSSSCLVATMSSTMAFITPLTETADMSNKSVPLSNEERSSKRAWSDNVPTNGFVHRLPFSSTSSSNLTQLQRAINYFKFTKPTIHFKSSSITEPFLSIHPQILVHSWILPSLRRLGEIGVLVDPHLHPRWIEPSYWVEDLKIFILYIQKMKNLSRS